MIHDQYQPAFAEPDALERHFTAQQLADVWSLDESTIRRMFQDEPGVLRIGKSARRDGKRDYMTLRIPESVARRVHRECTSVKNVQILRSRKTASPSPLRTAS